MKKVSSVISVLLVLLMLFSVCSFAADALAVTSVTCGGAALDGAVVDGDDVIAVAFSLDVAGNQGDNAALIGVYTKAGEKADYTIHPVENGNVVKIQLNDLAGGKYELKIGAGVKADDESLLGETQTVAFRVKENTVVESRCEHICHSDGRVAKFIWNFMNKIFKFLKINQYCECGEAHW